MKVLIKYLTYICFTVISYSLIYITPLITIFIVDDDEDDRKFFIEAVGELYPGIVFREFNNGQEALQAVQSTEISLPDLIFLDLNMPRLNGLQCLKQLKHNEISSEFPLLFIPPVIKTRIWKKPGNWVHFIILLNQRAPKDLKKEIEQVLTTLLNNAVNN